MRLFAVSVGDVWCNKHSVVLSRFLAVVVSTYVRISNSYFPCEESQFSNFFVFCFLSVKIMMGTLAFFQ